MRKRWAASFVVVGTISLLAAFVPASSGATGAPAREPAGCASDQFLVTVYTISTCIPLKFRNAIVEAHKNPAQQGVVFLNISGASEQETVCLRCHRRGKPVAPLSGAGGWR